MSAPAGAVTAMPAMPPILMTVPIRPFCHPCGEKKHAEKRADASLHVGHKKMSDWSGQVPRRCDFKGASTR
jgi:hypothetical protein